MKTTFFSPKLRTAVVALFVAPTLSQAVPLYFDQNGADPKFGIVGGQSYDWGYGTLPVWNTNSSGGTGTFSAWDNAAGDIAVFSSDVDRDVLAPTSWRVNLTSNITVSGLSFTSAVVAANQNLTFSVAQAPNYDPQVDSAQEYTLTFNPGSQIIVDQGSARPVIIGNHVNLSGSFTLMSSSAASQAGTFAYEGTGSQYTGTINTSGNVILTTYGASRFGKDTKLVLNTGGVVMSHSTTGNLTFGELSGNGGALNRSASNYTVTIDQVTTTNWAGQLGTSASLGSFKFAKSDVGTLVLNGAANHYIAQSVTINGGSLFVKADFVTSSNAANGIIVGNAGNFGGESTTVKHVTLNSASSQLTPGMYDVATGQQQIGTLTLANGLTATNGGTFNFTLNGTDGEGGTLNSLIEVTGGNFTLNGTKTANFFDLGTGNIQADTAYTIFTAAGITTAGWQIGYVPTGWEFGSFNVVENNLQVIFNVVPEPSAALLIGIFGLACLARRRFHSLKRP